MASANETPSQESLEYLWELRDYGLLCDGLLKTTDGGEFLVHRIIMASCSRYFRALFASLLYCGITKQEVLVPQVSKAALGSIVEFAYRRVTWVTWENVESLLEAAKYLCVTDVVKDCCLFLTSAMTTGNCISIHKLANAYNCYDLAEDAFRYIMRNFMEVSKKSEELLFLDLDELESLLSDENVNVIKEEIVWETVIRWIDWSPDSRQQHMKRLLKCVRTGLIDTTFFVEKITAHRYVAADESCRPLLIDTFRFLYDLDAVVHNYAVTTPVFARPRIPHEMMFVIGGWMSGEPTASIECYDTKADRWIKVEDVDPDGPRAHHKCVAIGYDIYVIGGFNGEDNLRTVRCFNASTKIWRPVNPMHFKRCYVSVAVVEDVIYAIGGHDGDERLNTAEKFDYHTNQWTMIAPMSVERSDACAASLYGYIYVIGGFNGQEYLTSAERYDLAYDQWSTIASMAFPRSGVGCVVFRDVVYAMGGFNGTSRHCSAEKYDPETGTWSTLPNMHTPRSKFAVAIIDNQVFAIGGFNGEDITNLVECYDPDTNHWYEATDLIDPRSASAACVVAELPNIRDYIHQRRDNLMEEKREKMLDILRLRSRRRGRDIAEND